MATFPPKKVNNADAGDSDHFGGDDLDIVADYFNNTNVTGPAKINTRTYFRDDKFELRNPADTFSYIFSTGTISADRVITVPTLTGNDTIVLNDFPATLTNKTLDSTCTIDEAIVIPDVAKLNAANAFEDFDSSFKDNRLRIWNPADTFRYTLVGSAIAANRNFTLPLLTGNDTVVAEAHTQTLTNKTIDRISNTLALRQFTTIVFKISTTYYAIKYDGTVVSSGSTFETVFQAALNLKGTVYLANTDVDGDGFTEYNCSAGLTSTGFSIPANTAIVGDGPAHTYIGVPQGYTGNLFVSNSATWISGIGLFEQGTPGEDWTGIKITCGSGQNASFGIIKDMQMYDINVGIELETTHSTGFINNNTFQDITIWSPVTGVLFDQTAGDIDENIFINTSIQSSSSTTNGFKDIDGRGNMFIGCKVWDPDSTATEANIKSTAFNTVINGGRMTGFKGHFVNQGTRTILPAADFVNNQNVWVAPSVYKMGHWDGFNGSEGTGILVSMTNIVVSTGSQSTSVDSTGVYRTFATGATSGSISGHRPGAVWTRRINNPYFKTAIYLNNNTNMRVYAGFTSSGSAPTSAADPLANLSGVALWFDSAVSANWKRGHNDGDATGDYDDTGVTASTGQLYPVEIYAHSDSKFRFVFNGVSTDITTEIPASTTNLDYWLYINNTTGSDRTMRAYYVEVKTEK